MYTTPRSNTQAIIQNHKAATSLIVFCGVDNACLWTPYNQG